MHVMTAKELDAEIAEKSADLHALKQAHDILHRRCIEVRDQSKSLLTPFHEWAGTHALMNSLDVFMNVASGTLEELKSLRANATQEPALRIVRDNE